MNDLITKKELLNYYHIDRSTFNTWVNKYKLPVIEITSHKKYIRKDELLKWEEHMKLKTINSFL